MTLPNSHDAPALRTDADVLDRVRGLVGPAVTDRQLWIMLVDGDDRQAPVVMPISDVPRRPEATRLSSLAAILEPLGADLVTARGPGSVILTLERCGLDAILPTDREWAGALTTMCEHAGMRLRGIFLSTTGGVRPLR